jgi:hypothetical protein
MFHLHGRFRGGIDDTTKIGKTVFGPDRPIVCEGILDAAADGPADAGPRNGDEVAANGRRIVAIPDTGEGDAARRLAISA